MTQQTHPFFAREGWLYMGLAILLAALVQWQVGFWAALPLWVIAILVIQFFRDPSRMIPQDPGLVLCPADGRVIVVEHTTDPYLQRKAIKVSIFMNVFNVHSNRIPVEGSIQDAWYFPGKFLNAAFDKASSENERNALWIRTPDGRDVTCVQIAGLVARRILCYVSPGEQVERGQRYGFIRFGSRLDVYLPPETQVAVTLGDKVTSGETVLARF